MRTLAVSIIVLAAVAALADDVLPPGHPPVTTAPSLPPGHPQIDPIPATPPLPPGHPPLPGAPADPALASVEGIVEAYYASISGSDGRPRDWDRFVSLFRPDARLVAVNPGRGDDRILELTPAEFVELNRSYFERGGYDERPIHDRVVSYGRVAHVWSTYESRRGRNAEPYARGINSFQLVSTGGRWWITGVVWDRERAGAPIPAEYLPGDER